VRDVTLDEDGQPMAGLPGGSAAQLELSPEARAAHDFEAKLQAARTMASSDPKAIAEVIKHWVSGDE
jgi:flagellar M-ring protein FliF